MLKTKLTRTSLVVLAVVLMLSVFSMAVCAEETTAEVDVTNDVLAAETEVAADDVTVDATADAEASEDASETVEENKDEQSDATETVPTTGTTETTEKSAKLDTNDIVSLVIFGVLVVVLAVYCIVKREKVGKFFRSLKSEFKKIVWSPWNQVRKNTIVVLVVVIAIAILVGVLDLIFNQGIVSLGRLF